MLPNRVKLKPLDVNNPDQVGFMFKVRTDPEVDKYLNGNPPQLYIEHVRYLTDKCNQKYFYIIDYDDDFAGYCQITPNDDSLEVGWALISTKQGLGIGPIAVKMLIDLCLKMSSKKIILYVREDNTRAISLYRKFNFIEKETNNGIILMELINER
jgi:RimJ/RimL family protein N-acetyltransferase